MKEEYTHSIVQCFPIISEQYFNYSTALNKQETVFTLNEFKDLLLY